MGPENPFVGLITTIFIMVLGFILVYKYTDLRTKNSHFVCPNCGCNFKLAKANFILAFKTGINERIVTCPLCGYKGRMLFINDK